MKIWLNDKLIISHNLEDHVWNNWKKETYWVVVKKNTLPLQHVEFFIKFLVLVFENIKVKKKIKKGKTQN